MMKNIKNRSIEWWVGITFCLVLFSVIAFFSYLKTDFIVKGVQIEANITHDDSSSVFLVNGNAKNSIHLNLNGREIFIDKNGNFSEKISLLSGFSIVSLEAEDKFGNQAEKKFNLVYKEISSPIAFEQNKSEVVN